MLKLFVSIIVLISFLFNITGSYLLFAVLTHQNKYLVHEKIEQNGFEVDELIALNIAVDDNDLIFVEDREFIYNDMLFDIVELSETKGRFIIKAYWDKKEENVKADFIAGLKNSHKPQKDKSNEISVKLLLKDFRYIDNAIPKIVFSTSVDYFTIRINNYFAPSQSIIQPPPEA